MRQLLHVLVVTMLTLCASASVAQEGERRVALVIGVAAYEQEIARLTNPIGDAQRVHAALRATGFETSAPLLNPSLQELQIALRDFGRTADRADVAVLYFAGHGIEQHNDNWLIPRDATLLHPDDVLAEGVSMQNVVRLMGRARLRIVFLDACRNNPFLVRWPGTRAGPDGLVRVADENLPQGTFVAFAAPAGQRAPDDGAFARSLAERIDDEGVSLEQLISRVSDDIGRDITISKQMQPADFFFVPGISEEDRFWQTFQADINAGRCDGARTDLERYASRRPREQTLVNLVRATVLPTCRQTAETVATEVAVRPNYLATLRVSDRTSLTRADFEAVAGRLGAEWETVAAVAEVESGPFGGFAEDGRPFILFERHLFSRKTNSVHDATHPTVSNRTPGGYPRTQAERWAQLEQAYALDAEAALQSTSYGRFLVLGQNFPNLAMANAHEYVSKLARSERDQLEAFEGFIRANGLADELQRRDWAGFARRYNGPGYAQNQYDTRMAEAYARLRADPTTLRGGTP
jgi:hypothetical protein